MATGAPGTNGVWQYGEDDSEATFSALLNKVASTADTQIGTDRGRLTTLEARKLSALTPIIPTGVTVSTGSGSYNSTTGLVTFTNAANINMAGVFSSSYKFYKIVIDVDPSAAYDYFAWFTNAGTSITTGWYGMSFYTVYSSGAFNSAAGRTNGNGSYIGYAQSSGNPSNIVIEAYRTSSKVQLQYVCHSRSFGGTFYGGYGTDGTNVDGFKISSSTGATMSGTMKIMGYN